MWRRIIHHIREMVSFCGKCRNKNANPVRTGAEMWCGLLRLAKRWSPTVADGEVPTEVCFTRQEDCCEKSKTIKVKDCGSYFIYKLQKPPRCASRYCSTDWMLWASHSAQWKDSQIDLLARTCTPMITRTLRISHDPFFMVCVKQWVVWTRVPLDRVVWSSK